MSVTRKELNEATLKNWQRLALAIIQENRRNHRFVNSKWCRKLLAFVDCENMQILTERESITRAKEKRINKIPLKVTYTVEFKRQVAKEYDESIMIKSKVAEKYNVPLPTLLRWLEQYSTRYNEERGTCVDFC